MELHSNYKENTRNQLIDAECPKMLIMIFDFVFLPMVQELMHELDSKFGGTSGPKAYPRTLLTIVTLYCFSENISKYKSMANECKKNKFLIIILDGKTPCRGTFANFLNKSDNEIIHRVFVSTLVLLNDLNALTLTRVFIDGTDALVRGSRYYYIKQRDLKAMELLNEWNLLHDGTPKKIKKTINELNIKLEEFKDDDEIFELINLVIRRIKIHKHVVYNKKDRYVKEFEKRGDVKLSIIFPESVYLKTKKEIFDFAFNLQAVMTDRHLIFTSLLLSQPNDQKVFEDVYKKIKKTLDVFLEMNKIYGQHDNGQKFMTSFLKIVIVADAGYFTVKNLYFIFINRINALIMPNTEARKENDKLRQKDKKEKSSEKIEFNRVKGGYECEHGKFLKFLRTIAIKHRKPQDEDVPDVCKTKRQIYGRKHCEGCPDIEKCPQKIEDRIPFLNRWMTEKYLDLRHRKHYSLRFSRSECINGFHKTTSILNLVGTTLNAVNNELDLRNVIYHLTRINTLKEEGN